MTRIGLAAAAFSVGALAWAAAIPLAAVVVASTSGMAVPKVAASAVYVAGAVVCHQKPERSFRLAGQPLPVCARSTGIYIGAALAVAALVGGSVRMRRGGPPLDPHRVRRAGVVALAPTLA